MSASILMPKGGQTTDESVLVKWNKKIGDTVNRGDVLFEIETDKAVMEVESFAKGELLEQRYNEGDTVSAGEIVAVVGEKNDGKQEPVEIVIPKQQQNDPANKAEVKYQEKEAAKRKSTKIIQASPAARLLAKTQGIDLAKLAAEIKDRPIKKEDILSKIESDNQKDVEQTTGRNSYVVFAEIDTTQLTRLIEEINNNLSSKGIKISLIDLMVKCTARALQKYPLLYGDIVAKGNVYTGADNKTVSQMVYEENQEKDPDSSRLAKLKIIDPGEKGALFVVPSIFDDEACILALGCIKETPIVSGSKIIIKPVMIISGAFDRNISDENYGAAFMEEVRRLAQDPLLFLV